MSAGRAVTDGALDSATRPEAGPVRAPTRCDRGCAVEELNVPAWAPAPGLAAVTDAVRSTVWPMTPEVGLAERAVVVWFVEMANDSVAVAVLPVGPFTVIVCVTAAGHAQRPVRWHRRWSRAIEEIRRAAGRCDVDRDGAGVKAVDGAAARQAYGYYRLGRSVERRAFVVRNGHVAGAVQGLDDVLHLAARGCGPRACPRLAVGRRKVDRCPRARFDAVGVQDDYLVSRVPRPGSPAPSKLVALGEALDWVESMVGGVKSAAKGLVPGR